MSKIKHKSVFVSEISHFSILYWGCVLCCLSVRGRALCRETCGGDVTLGRGSANTTRSHQIIEIESDVAIQIEFRSVPAANFKKTNAF